MIVMLALTCYFAMTTNIIPLPPTPCVNYYAAIHFYESLNG